MAKVEKVSNGDTTSLVVNTDDKSLLCGLVMPISAMDGCTADHWSDVKTIVTEAIEEIEVPRFNVKLVSDADEIGVIQKRIVQNLYTSDIIICDVSGKNPNVMFELGMRLAFDKPTVIIKDDKTDYSFDTGIIEHVPYPRDLRFNRMVSFKSVLADKVVASHSAAKKNADHSTFLKNFGKFHVATLDQDTVPADKLVVTMLNDLQTEIAQLRRTTTARRDPSLKERDSGMVRLTSEILRMMRENPKADISELMAQPKTRSELESRCDAPAYFISPTDFKNAIEKAIQQLSQSE